ncbi:hypothetical protein Sjap_026151 [Stephania japonica]|uniref:Amine oxidase domain-containing protein n=1 Tax=Stephania japonica TaxID=461633 RepID=A0AAP0HK67_9MAGN
MENAYPGSNILVVTLTNKESKRVEVQSEKETLREAIIGVLRDIFEPEVPTIDRILVPPWWNNHFQRGSYINYPIFATHQDFVHIKPSVGPIFFTGEHTNEIFNGYVHAEYVLLTGAFPLFNGSTDNTGMEWDSAIPLCIISQHRMFLSEEEGLQIRTFDFVDDLTRLRPDYDGNEWVSQSDDEKISEYKGLKLQEAVEWVVKNRLDEGQVWMIAVSSEGEVAYGFNSNAMFRGCATEDGFMEVGIWE